MGGPTLQEELDTLIGRVCHERRKEPDLALILEICEIIRTKTSLAYLTINMLKKYFKSENEVQCLIALFTLDMIVVNCGYPAHLAIAKKDFLNKLVFRFPPTPKHHMDKTHEHILHLLQKWCIALCERSKHCADFGNIRLMHSLLKCRGFTFPKVEESEIDALLTTEQFQKAILSPEELEQERRLVNEAKLEDLLRRGTPADLKAANELMKVMSGFAEGQYTSAESEMLRRLQSIETQWEELVFLIETCPEADSTKNFCNKLVGTLPQLQKWANEAAGATLEQLSNLINNLETLSNEKSPICSASNELIDLYDRAMSQDCLTVERTDDPNHLALRLIALHTNDDLNLQLWKGMNDTFICLVVNFAPNYTLNNVQIKSNDNVIVRLEQLGPGKAIVVPTNFDYSNSSDPLLISFIKDDDTHHQMQMTSTFTSYH